MFSVNSWPVNSAAYQKFANVPNVWIQILATEIDASSYILVVNNKGTGLFRPFVGVHSRTSVSRYSFRMLLSAPRNSKSRRWERTLFAQRNQIRRSWLLSKASTSERMKWTANLIDVVVMRDAGWGEIETMTTQSPSKQKIQKVNYRFGSRIMYTPAS